MLPLKLKGIDDENLLDKARSFLEEVGLGDRGDSYRTDSLAVNSKGLLLPGHSLTSRCLCRPMDPTGNLDYETGKKILDILNRLVRDNGRTIILATHDRDICSIADRVVELQGGKLHDVTEFEGA
ncbi:MAG: hypothetical protein U5K71_04405 [Gracilimonas sp.]|nr:hypothetical protein [Gracilimonas sp.]